MKKLVSIILIAVTALSIFGCSITGERRDRDKKKERIDIEEIKDIEGDLLVITRVSAGDCTIEQYEASRYTLRVTYSGYAYVPGSLNGEGVRMSDKDLRTIYEFCVNSYENDAFEDYSEQVCDGSTYSFVYYDEDGDAHTLYSGYCYSNKDLQNVIDIISYYCIDG